METPKFVFWAFCGKLEGSFVPTSSGRGPPRAPGLGKLTRPRASPRDGGAAAMLAPKVCYCEIARGRLPHYNCGGIATIRITWPSCVALSIVHICPRRLFHASVAQVSNSYRVDDHQLTCWWRQCRNTWRLCVCAWALRRCSVLLLTLQPSAPVSIAH